MTEQELQNIKRVALNAHLRIQRDQITEQGAEWLLSLLTETSIMRPFALACRDFLEGMAERGEGNEFMIAGHKFTAEQVRELQAILEEGKKSE